MGCVEVDLGQVMSRVNLVRVVGHFRYSRNGLCYRHVAWKCGHS